jgi:hypothetical protein
MLSTKIPLIPFIFFLDRNFFFINNREKNKKIFFFQFSIIFIIAIFTLFFLKKINYFSN